MSDAERIDQVDPDASPFESAPIEGLPFKRGSEEDLAIKRILGEDETASESRLGRAWRLIWPRRPRTEPHR